MLKGVNKILAAVCMLAMVAPAFAMEIYTVKSNDYLYEIVKSHSIGGVSTSELTNAIKGINSNIPEITDNRIKTGDALIIPATKSEVETGLRLYRKQMIQGSYNQLSSDYNSSNTTKSSDQNNKEESSNDSNLFIIIIFFIAYIIVMIYGYIIDSRIENRKKTIKPELHEAEKRQLNILADSFNSYILNLHTASEEFISLRQELLNMMNNSEFNEIQNSAQNLILKLDKIIDFKNFYEDNLTDIENFYLKSQYYGKTITIFPQDYSKYIIKKYQQDFTYIMDDSTQCYTATDNEQIFSKLVDAFYHCKNLNLDKSQIEFLLINSLYHLELEKATAMVNFAFNEIIKQDLQNCNISELASVSLTYIRMQQNSQLMNEYPIHRYKYISSDEDILKSIYLAVNNSKLAYEDFEQAVFDT